MNNILYGIIALLVVIGGYLYYSKKATEADLALKAAQVEQVTKINDENKIELDNLKVEKKLAEDAYNQLAAKQGKNKVKSREAHTTIVSTPSTEVDKTPIGPKLNGAVTYLLNGLKDAK